MEKEELIRQEIDATRESLSEKVETLEKKVGASVEEVVGAVEAVHQGVETVHGVLERFTQHPWLLVGGSALCGYALGRLNPSSTETSPTSSQATPRTAPSNGRVQANVPPAADESLLETFKPEMAHLKSLGLGVVLGAVREAIAAEAPPHVAEHLRVIIDGVTQKVGGALIPSSDFAPASATRAGEPPKADPNRAEAPTTTDSSTEYAQTKERCNNGNGNEPNSGP